ncbi:cytochrome b/b6 domain-containing protein [Paracoccus sp. Z118]|uniref:cytochrome b n=1 Tax=Paracoccus sp. Z118 TaxID=2851017 RepID=UPI001C2CC3DF|nr:cytochrome b/b6 domain-containing protein [Paracoccus sp. Z118]MBV0893528.1 cytochrome b/b6 domain-containing protein [Paracoccus sp. Z118]
MSETIARYPKTLVAIHWVTAAAVLGAWATAEGGREVVQNPPLLHFTLGLAVLALVLPRLVLRLMGGGDQADHRSRALAVAAAAGHGLLYALLIALPVTGWYAASQMGVQVQLLGLPLPALTAPIQGRPGAIAEFHESAGSIILLLAGLHALAAIWHQFVLRDGTLRRMSLR